MLAPLQDSDLELALAPAMLRMLRAPTFTLSRAREAKAGLSSAWKRSQTTCFNRVVRIKGRTPLWLFFSKTPQISIQSNSCSLDFCDF